MTVKRFTLKKYTSEDYAILDDGTEIAYASNKSAFTFCELLNELHEENIELHIQNDFLKDENQHMRDLVNENKQLKEAYVQLKHRHSLLHDVCIDAECDRDSYRKDIASLEKENEQLKKQLESEHTMLDNAILLERTRMGQNSLKQYKEAIQ